MLTHYIVQDVQPGAACSYRPGRTCLMDVFACPIEAQQTAERYNQCCTVPGVVYSVVAWDDTEELPCDYFQNGGFKGTPEEITRAPLIAQVAAAS